MRSAGYTKIVESIVMTDFGVFYIVHINEIRINLLLSQCRSADRKICCYN